MKLPNRHERRAKKATSAPPAPPTEQEIFASLTRDFIDLANKANRKHSGPQVAMPFLYAAARYTAFIGKSVLKVEDHDTYLEQLTQRFHAMLKEHLADPSLD